jgi:hypothetical protein
MLTVDEICGGPELASTESRGVEATASSIRPPSPDNGRRTGSERIAGRISQLLTAHRPALFCDDCIADRLALNHRRQANRATTALADSSAFWRAVAACSDCNKHKQVIRHV